MGVKIPATFEDSTGTIARLTGELEFDVPATPGEVLTADNPASTASFAAGAVATVQAVYQGNAVNIGNGASANLTWDTLSTGTALLDLTDPANPTFLTDGTYAVTALFVGDALTAAGYAAGQLTVAGAALALNETQNPADTWSTSGTVVASAGDILDAPVVNEDGVSARNFNIRSAVVVKLA